jgi:hypothetical protein
MAINRGVKMGLFDILGGIGKGALGIASGNPLAAISAVAGGLGSIFGGGGDDEQTQELFRQLSPEQRALIGQLQTELDTGGFDIGEITSATRERLGNESSALRIAAMNRLRRAGVAAPQIESGIADQATQGLRVLGSTLAGLEFSGQQAEAGRRSDIFRQLGGIAGGPAGASTTTATASQAPGLGFAQLFGSGLQGLMNPPPRQIQQPRARGQSFFQNPGLNF